MKQSWVKEDVYDYVIKYGCDVAENKYKLRQETTDILGGKDAMLSSVDQGEFMKMLIKIINAKKGIEIGTFTGYGTLCFAEALPEDGYLITLDVTDEFPNIGKKYWEEAKVDHKIDLRIGPAVDELDKLIQSEENLDSFDFGFLDADKESYPIYYEKLLKLLKPNGIIIVDNYLLEGRVVKDEIDPEDVNALAIRKLGEIIKDDDRVERSTLCISDGVCIVRKK